jgi:hypothetical protein
MKRPTETVSTVIAFTWYARSRALLAPMNAKTAIIARAMSFAAEANFSSVVPKPLRAEIFSRLPSAMEGRAKCDLDPSQVCDELARL